MKGHNSLSVSEPRKGLWRWQQCPEKDHGLGPWPHARMYARTCTCIVGRFPYTQANMDEHVCVGCLWAGAGECKHAQTRPLLPAPPEVSRIFLGHKSEAVTILLKTF